MKYASSKVNRMINNLIFYMGPKLTAKQKQGILGLKPYNSIIFILGTLDWLGSAEPSMSWLVVEVGK